MANPVQSSPLISAEAVHQQLSRGKLQVVDCRFSLADTDLGLKKYRESHIPGAHYVHLDHDLSSPIIEGSGRHPLPTQEQVVHLYRRCGLNDDTPVVFYDDAGGAIAARAWWLCQWLGHEFAQVLDGGLRSWTDRDYPLSSEMPAPGNGRFSLRPARVSYITADKVMEKNRLLVDARDPDRYAGKTEPLDPVAGHIPGAFNQPFADNLDDNGCFLPHSKLAEKFGALQSEANGRTITHYCGSGVTAAHNILAMTAAGLEPGQLYAGSWSEWVQDRNRPFASV